MEAWVEPRYELSQPCSVPIEHVIRETEKRRWSYALCKIIAVHDETNNSQTHQSPTQKPFLHLIWTQNAILHTVLHTLADAKLCINAPRIWNEYTERGGGGGKETTFKRAMWMRARSRLLDARAISISSAESRKSASITGSNTWDPSNQNRSHTQRGPKKAESAHAIRGSREGEETLGSPWGSGARRRVPSGGGGGRRGPQRRRRRPPREPARSGAWPATRPWRASPARPLGRESGGREGEKFLWAWGGRELV